MSRLIEADAIPYVTDETRFHEFDYAYRYAIDALPTVDAVPVVHGRWQDEGDLWLCTACGKGYVTEVGVTPIDAGMYYCPNCGADMRGEQDG